MNVTLFDNGQTYELGDVNQDGVVNITDLTCLIDHLLDDSIVINYECSDMNADGEITIGDVTGLIDLLLRGHWCDCSQTSLVKFQVPFGGTWNLFFYISGKISSHSMRILPNSSWEIHFFSTFVKSHGPSLKPNH